MFDYDTDSDKVSDVLEDDLERGSATLAAFVVTLITVTFFGTLVSMISVTMSLSGDYQVGNKYLERHTKLHCHHQGRVIAHGLCSNLGWAVEAANGSSWCENKIFNIHFDTNLHCPCFLPEHISNNTFISPPFVSLANSDQM